MAFDTYEDLLGELASLLERDDLASALPGFIRLCETDVDSREDLATHRRRTCRAEAVIDGEYAALPDDYMGVSSIQLETPVVDLQYASPDNFIRLKQDEAQLAASLTSQFSVSVAPPAYYTIVGAELRFLPVPTQEYTVQMGVYERLPALADAGANWLLRFYPSIYLYGSALHSAPWLKDDARIDLWTGLYERACKRAAAAEPQKTERVALRTELVGLVGRGR